MFLGVFLAWENLRAGGSGFNVIVVVNPNSANSLQLGNDYCEQRGVPPQNFLRLTNWTGGPVNWAPADFQNDLLNPLLNLIASRGLTNQAQFVLLSMDIPYRVTDGSNLNSTTAALFYGFKTNGPPPDGGVPASCSLPDNTSNSYAFSELPFLQAPPNTAATNSFLAMLLTDVTLAGAENILRRAVASDSSSPTQSVYLAKTSDEVRSLRFTEFDNAVFENQVVGNYALSRIATDSMSFTNLFGLEAGLGQNPYSLNADTFVPGALGDTLTSFAGFILDTAGQTTALAYLEAGASGSYGTIVEPCAWTPKFPDPVDYFYQTRGFSLAEAYFQSVLNPFQGLFVGEPLAAPFAHPGTAQWSSLTNGAILSGQSVLSPVFTAANTNLPLTQVDLFVDGTFFATMTNLPPAAGNVLSAVLSGITVNYIVPTNATLATVASGLADAINQQSSVTNVVAFAAGDRVELQATSVYVPGSNVTVSASSTAGSAPSLTTGLNPARPAFLDTVATGYQVVTLNNAPQVNDWLAVTFMKTNGTIITLAVTNTVAGASSTDFAQTMINLIATTPALQTADGVTASDLLQGQFYVYANTPGWPAAQILATWTGSADLQVMPAGPAPLADNVNDLRPRNHLYVTSGTNVLAVNYACDTTQWADGYHQLTAVAYEGSSVATQTRVTRNVIVQNTSLTAVFAASPASTNVALGQTVQLTVTANTANTARIELFSTGGSQGVVTNQSAAIFTVPTAFLGAGLHPFYAVVTDQAGHRYQTQTLWYRIIAMPLTLSGGSLLSWPATPGWQYHLQLTTNLAAGFQTVAVLTATNWLVQWPLSPTNQTGFYRVELAP